MVERLRTRVEEVTPRQLEVARLVAAGRTNPEIAEALGITLDGAKYHVSELLGRLGLERREEIAHWYRDEARPRRFQWARALVGSPLALGGVAAGLAGAVVLGVLLVSALDGARVEDQAPATATATPSPTPTEAVEVPEGTLAGAIAVGDASDMPEHLQAITFAFQQRLHDTPLEVLRWEEHAWQDGCFDLDFPGGCPLSVSPVPGYRISLRGAEGEYVLRTDIEATRYRVEAAPPVDIGNVVFTWTGGESVGCLDLQVDEDGRGAIAGCGEPSTAFDLAETGVGQSGMLQHLLNYRISAERDPDATWQERVAVRGDEDSTGPGIERAALEFGSFLAIEAHAGRSGASFALAVAWGDEDADACTSMEVQWFGMAYRTCEDPSEPSRIYFAEEPLQQMYEWLDTYTNWTVEDETAPRTFLFNGRAPQNPDPAARYPDQETALEIRDWFEAFAQ